MNTLTLLTLDKPDITDFAKERNALLERVKTDWVLFLDKDETLTKELKAEIEHTLANPTYGAYTISRLDTFLGRQLRYGESGHTRLVRLAKASWGQWERPVHEVWRGKGRVGELSNPIPHHPHPSLAMFLSKIDRYSSLEAAYRHRLHKRSSLLNILFFPLGKFVHNYFIRQGFRDGLPGLIHAVLMSFHSYLTWTKLYLLWHKH